MTSPRIAYLINSVEGGGAASPVPAIAGVLRGTGATVRVFALTGRDRRALGPIIEAGLDPLVRDGGENDHIAAARWMLRQVREWEATHIWTSLSRATILGLALRSVHGLPVICWQHNAFLKPWNRKLMRLLHARAALWVADSRSVEELTHQRLRVDRGRLVTWPIFFADPAMPQAAPWRPGEPIRVGSLGRLHTAKGYDILITALARLRAEGFNPPAPLKFTIAGDGADLEWLTSRTMEAGVPFLNFTGFTPDPRSFLASQHLYVQPSRREGFCIAAHEALTAGLPVIASAVGELRHSIEEGKTGYLVPPKDTEALTDKLARALANPARLFEMGQAARRDMLTRFSYERFKEIGEAIMGRVA